MSVVLVMPSNHLILCHSLLLPSIFTYINVFSSESAFHIRWLEYLSFSFSTCPSNEYSGLISFQFSSVAQSCLTLCNPMDGSTPGLPVHHQLQEFTNMFFLLTNYLKIYLHRRTKMSSSPNFFPPLKIHKYIHDDTGMLQFMGSQRVGHN